MIAEVKRHQNHDMPVIIDMPPGTSCSFVEAAEGCDHVLLVAEPSPFGLHDLHCAVKALNIMEINYSVFVNRSTGSGIIDQFCIDHGIPVSGHLAEDMRIARSIADGKRIIETLPEYRQVFTDLWDSITGSLS